MSDITPIEPSDVLKIKASPEEINCAATISSAIHEGFKKAGLKDGESLVSKLALADSLCDILIEHTRCDGLTAAQWKAKFEELEREYRDYRHPAEPETKTGE